MKKLYIKTYGCQMNVYDSARMADLLAPLGYAPVDAAEGADMVILNTCHIREKATEKVYSELGKLKQLKTRRAEAGNPMLVAVAGCVAQAEGAEIMARQPAVDMVVGPQSYHRLPEMIARVARGGGHALETDFPAEDKFDHLPEERAAAGRRRLSHHPGRLRQVLHLLRRSLYARRRILAARGADRRRGAPPCRKWRRRNHAARAERECLSRRRTGRHAVGVSRASFVILRASKA